MQGFIRCFVAVVDFQEYIVTGTDPGLSSSATLSRREALRPRPSTAGGIVVDRLGWPAGGPDEHGG